MKKKWDSLRLLLFTLALCVILGGCSAEQAGSQDSGFQNSQTVVTKEEETEAAFSQTSTAKYGRMKVHFIDVGQGSAVLVEAGTHYMLVDGGDSNYSSKVVSYLKKQGIKTLDFIIATHYDSDHLNGVVGALNVFSVKKVIAPDYETDTRVFRSFLSALDTKEIQRINPVVGKKYKLGKAVFQILAPGNTEYDDENNYSVAIRLTHGKKSFVFTGDAEAESEYEMIDSGKKLSCDVYLVGHHGSNGSSSQSFLQKLNPKYAVVSVGADNSYGHPAQGTMARLQAMECQLYRTDVQGTIVAVSNGKKITFRNMECKDWSYGGYKNKIQGDATAVPVMSQDPAGKAVSEDLQGTYLGNVNSKVYHKDSCSGLPYEKNRIFFDSVGEAENAGYRPCGNCHPDI